MFLQSQNWLQPSGQFTLSKKLKIVSKLYMTQGLAPPPEIVWNSFLYGEEWLHDMSSQPSLRFYTTN